MGRRRTLSPDWLPRRVYPHRKQYIYRPLGTEENPKPKPIPLGPISDPGACLKKYGEIVGPGERPRTMGEVIDRYLREVVPGRAPRTQEDYRAYCGKLKKAFAHMPPGEITIDDLYAYHDARKAPVRANREITVLGVIYRHAIRWRACAANPVRDFLYAEETTRERVVTGSERRRFARGYCPDWLRGYMALKYLTGRRQGEMLKLGLFSEQPAGIAFRVLKKRKPRELVVQWTPRLRKVWNWLKALPRPANSVMLFHGEREHKPVTARGLKSVWQRAMTKWEEAGNQRFWEHDIRAATATASKSDEAARELLDHENVRTTRRSYRRGVPKVRPLR